jgi:5-methylcytosine-specific restriction enzyme A
VNHHRTRPDRGWCDPAALPRGPNGRACCRKCGVEVPKGRRSFCSEECVHQWKIEADPGYLRRQVEQRDRGFCARCRLDTDQLRRQLAAMRDRCKRRNLGAEARKAAFRDFARYRAIMDRLKLREGDTLWEADHIVPVVEGGGCCGLDGIRTLCRWCHLEVTAELAARRAERRRDEHAVATLVTRSRRWSARRKGAGR